MRLAVLGATGGLGRHVVDQALEGGHHVVGLARTPGKLARSHDRLELVEGLFQDPDALRRAVEGADGVLSCVGYAKGQDPAVFGEGMRALVGVMKEAGVRRLVAISGAGLVLEGDAMPLSRRVIIAALKLFSPKVLEGKQREWEALDGADVDWTLVRVGRMVDKDPKGEVAVDADAVTGSPMVAYPDVARWMIDQVDDSTWIHRAPFVSGG
jgi:putative NADH-flavin reductase